MKMRYLWRFMQPFRCRPNRPEANIKRIVDAGEAACGEEAVAKAAASLGYKITPEELKRTAADFEELSESDLEQVSGGTSSPIWKKL